MKVTELFGGLFVLGCGLIVVYAYVEDMGRQDRRERAAVHQRITDCSWTHKIGYCIALYDPEQADPKYKAAVSSDASGSQTAAIVAPMPAPALPPGFAQWANSTPTK